MNVAGSSRERLIGPAFVSLADSLVDEYDVIELLTRLVGHCVELRLAEAAGLVLADAQGTLRVVASSSEDARLIELMQVQADEGPCLDCYRGAAPVDVTDLADAGDRWPVFVRSITVGGGLVFRSVHALPLRLRGHAIGALNLFGRGPGALPAEDLALGQALADVSTIAILQERAIRHAEVLSEQLQFALNSRVIIEQAKGVLAQHSGLGMDDAFTKMRGYARFHNKRLSEVARALSERTLDPGSVIAPPRRP